MSAGSTGSTGLAERYATALFALAEADKVLDKVSEDLATLAAMLDASEDLRRLVRSPVIGRQDQVKAMDALMEKAAMGSLARRFVGVVVANRRLFALSAMIAAYRRLLSAKRGEATAEVVSARTLSEKQLAAIGEALKKAIGATVAVDAKVDPELLGGLVVKVGSRMVDSSLRTKLQQLRLAMKGVG